MKITAENLPPVMPQSNGMLTFTIMTKEQGKFKTYVKSNVSFKLENTFKKSTKTVSE